MGKSGVRVIFFTQPVRFIIFWLKVIDLIFSLFKIDRNKPI
jgi:hypothetical protein